MQDIFKKSLEEYDYSLLNEEKESLALLKTNKIKLLQDFNELEKKVAFYDEKLNFFTLDYEHYLNKIKSLAKNLNIEKLSNSSEQDGFLHFNEINLTLSGEFDDLLEFIRNLENQKEAIELKNITISSVQSLNLKLDLKLAFVCKL